MNFIDLIYKKRDNEELSTEEINFFVECVTKELVPDYQISALLMAITLNSLNYRETYDLTMAMVNSGDVIDLGNIQGIKVDKHSTGGVGDTTTLVLAPLVASCGLPVVKMSGKGLANTGGTIDKLESISGFNTALSVDEAISIVQAHGVVIMGQTDNLTPADKKLYALRDVTGTVFSIPLIASSIMSKKIATGSDAIVLDVKCGNGAFMREFESAKLLAETMLSIGKLNNKKVVCLITDMDTPLGFNIGNSFELIEAIEILKGNIAGELKNVSLTLGANMLILGDKAKDVSEAKAILEKNIENGRGLVKLKELIEAQGGNAAVVDDYSLLPKSKICKELKAEKSGFVFSMDTLKIGNASLETGAGRRTKSDSIDYGAGIIFKKRTGDSVTENEVIAEIYSSDEEKCSNAINLLKEAVVIEENQPKIKSSIIEIIQ